MKKAQTTTIAIVLILLVLVVSFIAIFLVVYPNISGNVIKQSQQNPMTEQKKLAGNPSPTSQQIEISNKPSYDIQDLVIVILDNISQNEEIRNAILRNDLTEVNNYVVNKIPIDYDFTIKICSLNEDCSLYNNQVSVFTGERKISSTSEDFAPQKVKLFIWKKL